MNPRFTTIARELTPHLLPPTPLQEPLVADDSLFKGGDPFVSHVLVQQQNDSLAARLDGLLTPCVLQRAGGGSLDKS